jgi:hypothetical protein
MNEKRADVELLIALGYRQEKIKRMRRLLLAMLSSMIEHGCEDCEDCSDLIRQAELEIRE